MKIGKDAPKRPRVTHGPFTWEKQEPHGKDEVWKLVAPEPLYHFVIKNYGGIPGPGFSGWKLVSGGPFDEPGAYSSLTDAMKGITPWLAEYLLYNAEAKKIEAMNMAAKYGELARCMRAVDPKIDWPETVMLRQSGDHFTSTRGAFQRTYVRDDIAYANRQLKDLLAEAREEMLQSQWHPEDLMNRIEAAIK